MQPITLVSLVLLGVQTLLMTLYLRRYIYRVRDRDATIKQLQQQLLDNAAKYKEEKYRPGGIAFIAPENQEEYERNAAEFMKHAHNLIVVSTQTGVLASNCADELVVHVPSTRWVERIRNNRSALRLASDNLQRWIIEYDTRQKALLSAAQPTDQLSGELQEA